MFKPAKDDLQITESDLSKQLHSSVRTPNLETSLRLLSQGADPNYFHPDKNSTPLSVASRAGQVCQVELLLVYGADPGATDLEGKTAVEHAKVSGYPGLATRIQSAQFELSDRLSFFLCGKKPDHVTKHYLIPELNTAAAPDPAKLARRKMTGLSNKVFEELAIDVYDEVDRRETDNLWTITETSQPGVLVPFLPVNPDYGATRNQGRQKLARLTQTEFASLVVDVLKEIRRRQSEMTDAVRTVNGDSKSEVRPMSDDEPLYDSVASDEDYYMLPDKQKSRPLKESEVLKSVADAGEEIVDCSDTARTVSACSNNTLQRSRSLAAADREVQSSEFSALKEQLECSEKKVQALIASNDDMRSELAKLQNTVKKLVMDNKELQRASMSPSHTGSGSYTSHDSPGHTSSRQYSTGDSMRPVSPAQSPVRSQPQSPGSRSHSMYEYRAGSTGPTSLPGPGSSYISVGAGPASPRTYQSPVSRRESHDGYNTVTGARHYPGSYAESGTHSLPYTLQHNNYNSDNATLYQVSSFGRSSVQHFISFLFQEVLPSQEEVVRRTEAITRCIQELLISAKDEKVQKNYIDRQTLLMIKLFSV